MKRQKGFTLIELLIVVAIIGILAALLIPNVITAIQKTKQKSTMKSIAVISTGLTNYITDHGQAPAISKQLTAATDTELDYISPFYVQTAKWADEWGHGFFIYTQTNADGTPFNATIEDTELGSDSFLVGSSGRNIGTTDSPGSYDVDNPEAGLYVVDSMAAFNYELVMYNGAWIIGPQTAGGGEAGS